MAPFCYDLVLIIDLLSLDDRQADEVGGVEVGIVHLDSRNLVVVVGGVVEDAFLQVVAGAINRVLVLALAEVTAAVLLVDRV